MHYNNLWRGLCYIADSPCFMAQQKEVSYVASLNNICTCVPTCHSKAGWKCPHSCTMNITEQVGSFHSEACIVGWLQTDGRRLISFVTKFQLGMITLQISVQVKHVCMCAL